MASAARVVLLTHPARGAAAFARQLVELRLAACVQLAPIESHYRWRGRVESARELLLLVKTTAARVPALERHVRARHPHEVPELVALAPAKVGASYLAWLRAESAPPRGRARRDSAGTR